MTGGKNENSPCFFLSEVQKRVEHESEETYFSPLRVSFLLNFFHARLEWNDLDIFFYHARDFYRIQINRRKYRLDNNATNHIKKDDTWVKSSDAKQTAVRERIEGRNTYGYTRLPVYIYILQRVTCRRSYISIDRSSCPATT